MKVFVSNAKFRRVQHLSKKMLLRAQGNRHLVSIEDIRRFCGVCISLTLAVPLAIFYTRSLFFEKYGSHAPRYGRYAPSRAEVVCSRSFQTSLSARPERKGRRMKGNLIRLSNQSLRDLRYWRSLTRGRIEICSVPPKYDDARGCGRCRIRRYSGLQHGSWVPGFVGGSRFLVGRRHTTIDQPERAASASSSSPKVFC